MFLLFRVGQGGDVFYWGPGPRYPTTTTSSTVPPPTTTTTTTIAPSTTTTTTTTTSTTPSSTAGPAPFQQPELVVGDLGGVFAYHPQPREGTELVMTERAENDLVFGVLTSVGYFFITIVLVVGILMGDKQKYTVGI